MVKDVAWADDGVVLTVRACLHVLVPQTSGYGGRTNYPGDSMEEEQPGTEHHQSE